MGGGFGPGIKDEISPFVSLPYCVLRPGNNRLYLEPGGWRNTDRLGYLHGRLSGPMDWSTVFVNGDKAGSVPYSNQAVVVSPFGFTDPLRVAELIVMSPACVVTVVGGGDVVVKFLSSLSTHPRCWKPKP